MARLIVTHDLMRHRRRFPLHVHITARFLILLLIVGGVMGGLGYTVNRDILRRSASSVSERVGRDMLRELRSIVGPTEMATRLLSHHAVTRATSLEQRLEHLRFMVEALAHSAELTALYVGYANGDFFLLRRIASAAERNDLAAPEDTVFLVQSIDHPDGKARGRFIYLDSSLAMLASIERPDYAQNYDPRSRDWYAQALATNSQIITSPYAFFTTGIVGTTVARRADASGAIDAVDAVVGADIRLGSIARALSDQKATPGTQVVLANSSGQIVVDEDGRLSRHDATPLTPLESTGDPLFAQLAPIVRTLGGGGTRNLEVRTDAALWQVSLSALELEGSDALVLITAIPDAELVADAYTLLRHAGLVMAVVLLLAVPVIWATARVVSKPLRRLAGEVDAIRHFAFSPTLDVDSSVREVDDLAQATAMMKRTISRFLHISETIAAENDFDRLLPHLLGETIAAASADAGVLYLVDSEILQPAASLRADGSCLAGPPKTSAATRSPLLQRALTVQTACAAPLTDADIAALDLAAAVAACGASHGIAIPLQNRKNVRVGAMVLLLRRATDSAQLSFINALCGSVAVSLEAKESIRAQKQLFEAMIRLIAGAIDAKSPYTGGHCARVPEIAKGIARAACAQTDGPFAGFALDDDGWEALHIAAWLHDCGKVTTPEYVVDKATKLETIYDRIHEIRMRFEVLKRDAHIACLEAIAGGEPEARAQSRLTAEWAQLDADFAFVAACNEGGEAMLPEQLQRLQAIAARRWRRTLDDRLGVSRDEALRRARTPAPDLPVDEPLIADKPEHCIERSAIDTIADAQGLGIRLATPELRYNRGELYNLSIARGTLSSEERYKINEHIVQSMVMLNRLPFPKHLRGVPEIACGHHEKIDGSGYPRRLSGDQMSVLARLMAIADIFEALTAADRPYKRGKTLSEAIGIMARMRDERHIDADLFELFLCSGTYLDYAHRFMRAEQIDDVDLAAYLGSTDAR